MAGNESVVTCQNLHYVKLFQLQIFRSTYYLKTDMLHKILSGKKDEKNFVKCFFDNKIRQLKIHVLSPHVPICSGRPISAQKMDCLAPPMKVLKRNRDKSKMQQTYQYVADMNNGYDLQR